MASDLLCNTKGREHIVKRSWGFSLIELMIVVAIIAILAAIAIPAYQQYTVRARVSEALLLAESPKATVAENIAGNGGNLGAGSCNGLKTEAPGTSNLALIDCDDDTGTLTFVTSPAARSMTLTFQPTPGSVNSAVGTTWQCRSATVTDAPYLPADCR